MEESEAKEASSNAGFKHWLSRVNEWLGFQPKDWITVTLSILAFIISGTTSYFSFFWQSDHLKMALGDKRPYVFVSDDPLRAAIGGNLDVAFVNSGNRHAIVQELYLVVSQSNVRNTKCPKGGWPFGYNFGATVIKAGEALVSSIELKDAKHSFVYMPIEDRKGTIHILFCMHFSVITGSVSLTDIGIPIASHTYDRLSKSQPERAVPLAANLVTVYKN